MTVLPPLRSAALVLMSQNLATQASQLAEHGPTDAILAAMTESEPKAGVSALPGQVEAALSESIFSVNHKGVTEMKFDLVKRTGEELGVNIDDYDSAQAYGAALQKVVRELRLQPSGEMALRAIERKLGLDDLGLSLDDAINAASDPNGEAGNKVEKALAAYYGIEEDGAANEEQAPFLVLTDEAGLYGLIAG